MIIKLPNGSHLVTSDLAADGERLVFISEGLSIAVEYLPVNDECLGTDAWANKEIDIYQEALHIDLRAHRDALIEYILNYKDEV